MEEERLWKFRKPEWLNSAWARNAGVYSAGALVRRTELSIVPIDLISSASLGPPCPGLSDARYMKCSPANARPQYSLAFYVMLDSAVWSKSARNGSSVHVSYSGSGVAWKARVVLFLGFAALAGGMAGGVTVFVLKFVVPGVEMPALGMGIENIVSNALVGFRYVLRSLPSRPTCD